MGRGYFAKAATFRCKHPPIPMKHVFLFPLLLFSLSASAQGTGMEGRWKEVRRESAGARIPFTDTARLTLLPGNEYTWGRPMSFTYRGTYKRTKDVLDLGRATYTVVSASADKLVLRDREGTYTFAPDAGISNATDNSAATNGTRAATPDAFSGAPASIGALMGRWEVYKRTSSTVQQSIDYSRQLRVIEVMKNGDGEQGLVFASNDMQNKPSWYMERYADGTIFCAGRDKRELKVLHQAGDELVVSEGDMTYFLKRFKN